jgi:uncharacterized iron-regulated protein
MRFMLACLVLMSALPLLAQEYAIFDTATGKPVPNVDQLASALNDAQVVFFGEIHDDAVIHSIEARFLEAWHTVNGANTVVSMEMFERDVQVVMDDYLAGKIDAKAFMDNSRPWPNYPDYQPMVEFAKAHHLPVLASNVPRPYAARVNQEGPKALEELTPEERKNAARELKTPDDEYKKRFLATMQANIGGAMGHAMAAGMDNLYAAQCLKDDTMAESMADYLVAHPNARIVHYVGEFHSTAGLGTPAKLTGLRPATSIAVISPIAIPVGKPLRYTRDMASEGRFVILVHRSETEEGGK